GSVSGVARAAGAHNVFTMVVANLNITSLSLVSAVNILSQQGGFTVSESFPDTSGETVSIVIYNSGGSVHFPAISKDSSGTDFGMVAIVGAAGTYSLMQALPGQPIKVLAPSVITGGGADLAPSGNISIGKIFLQDFELVETFIDELSLWDRALSVDDFAA